MLKIATIASLATLLGAGCAAPPASQGGFDSPTPGAKMYAIEYAIERNERSVETTAHIVEQLDSDDPAVRLLAGLALRHLCGTDLGYHYDDAPYVREQAILQWVKVVDEGLACPDAALPSGASSTSYPGESDG